MFRFIIFIVSFVAILAWHKRQEREQRLLQQEYARQIATTVDACTGKERCALIYLAPWCPACNSQLPAYKTLLGRAQSHEKYGVKVVVGAGQSPAHNNEMIAKLGTGALPDHDGKVKAVFAVDKFPSYFVLDGQSKVVLKDLEAFQWINAQYSGAPR